MTNKTIKKTKVYLCTVCGTQAKKEPCKASADAKGSLGTWNCPRCVGKVTVHVQ